ncbi:GntR family transcriptional regulator [Leucobacter weissii]|uniref:GntR family transcriptional regulator n=1 Tax=Leucobacter weissii TaxID=1983706 RepID=A0A939S6X1_9MICO|nr:GntR family transcriptional regulator [Leucobacter weissii]MBO1900341.1 GntR family transcriptional regulator [Leucobacter weissii]
MSSPEAVADELRGRILRLEVGAGAPLREVALAAEFGCSRRTVREALLRLDREGVVAHERNRGASVRRLGESAVRDLYRVRRSLETAGARACAAASDERLAATGAAFERLAASARSAQDTAEHALADMRFHAAVIGLVGSPRLDRFFEEVAIEMAYAIRLLQRDEVETRIGAEGVIEEHRRIHDAVLARNPAAAEAAVLEHIDENERRLVRLCSAPD